MRTTRTTADKSLQTQASTSEASTSEAGSLVPNCNFEAAASESSTTAFAGYASSCTKNKAPTRQRAVAAADLMSGVSTELEPASTTSHAPSALSDTKQIHPSISHPPHTSCPRFDPLSSEAVASNPSDTVKAKQTQTTCNVLSPAHTEASTAQLADDTGYSKACSQAQPMSSQPAALVCRRDMSFAALAVQATFAPPSPDPTAALPPSSDAEEAQPSAKRQKRVFLHGNYNRYYGYRLGAALEEDPRVQVRRQSWLHVAPLILACLLQSWAKHVLNIALYTCTVVCTFVSVHLSVLVLPSHK